MKRKYRFFVAEWMPINTAPQDGSYILVAAYDFPEGRVVRAHFKNDRWCAYYGNGQLIKLDARLWMPIPPMPNISELKDTP